MIEYKCGHESDGIIILDDNELSMSAYLEWFNGRGLNGTKELCWDCYCNNNSTKNLIVKGDKQ